MSLLKRMAELNKESLFISLLSRQVSNSPSNINTSTDANGDRKRNCHQNQAAASFPIEEASARTYHLDPQAWSHQLLGGS